MSNAAPRKPYTPPTLHVHGPISQLTKQVRPRATDVNNDFETLESSNAKFDTNV